MERLRKKSSINSMVLVLFFAIGMCLLFVGFTNVLNIRQAIKTGIVSGRWEKYDRRKTPMLYKITFSGSVLAIVMCSLLGIVSIGAGIFLQLSSN